MSDAINELYKIVKNSKKEDYPGIIEERAEYSCLYHLSEVRENLIRSLPLHEGMRVLELHAECGALTGRLLELTKNVTAVTENDKMAAVIRERTKESAGLTIVTGLQKLAEAETYDVILLVGKTYALAEKLPELKERLADGGRLFIADANRLGLKYFAGYEEEYAGGYFSGVEGYPDGRDERCYTKKEYEELLKQSGFEILRWYYPYPDYLFPSVLYSDVCQPERGELSDNRRNFKRDRYQFFEETRAFDSMISEGLFPELSNSFLIEACAQKEKISSPFLWECHIPIKTVVKEDGIMLYTKYSGERARKFAIKTEVIEKNASEIRVYKEPLYAEGEKHIAHILKAYERLAECYKHPGISFVEGRQEGNAASFPFVQGRSLQDMIEKAVSCGNRDRVREILGDYIARISQDGGTIPFEVTKEFQEIFGDIWLPDGLESAEITDIDMTFPNILMIEEGRKKQVPQEYQWNIIDYEWTFFFPIPKKFTIYRGLHYAYNRILKDAGWSLQELLAAADITEPMQQAFMKMDWQLQFYVGKGTLSLRNMQPKMGTRSIPLDEMSDSSQDMELYVQEEEYLMVRKIKFHIEQMDYQEGSVVCSGWAYAGLWYGRKLPVHIHITDENGDEIAAEIRRSRRVEAAEWLKIRRVTDPKLGFECRWTAPPGKKWKVHFSMGKSEKIAEIQ